MWCYSLMFCFKAYWVSWVFLTVAGEQDCPTVHADRHVGVLLQKQTLWLPSGKHSEVVMTGWGKMFLGQHSKHSTLPRQPHSVLGACQGCVIACPNMTALSTCHSSKSQKKSRACFHRTAGDTQRIMLSESAALRAVLLLPKRIGVELFCKGKNGMLSWLSSDDQRCLGKYSEIFT